MIFPTSFSPQEPVTLFDGLSIHPLTRGIIDNGYGTSHLDAIRLDGYEKTDGAMKAWAIFHTFILNSRQTADQYEWSYGGGRDFSLIEEELANRIDYDRILPWVYFHDNESAIGTKNSSYAKLYQKYKTLSPVKIALIRNYLNDFSRTSKARSINRTISDPSYWQMMVYYSIIEKILGMQQFCAEHHHCKKCGKATINHYPMSQFEWTKSRLTEIIGSDEIAETYRAVIWAVRQKIRHDTVHSALTPDAEQGLPQESDRVLFDLERSIGNYKEDHHAVESLIHMLADIARYLLLDDIYSLKIFPAPRPLGVITLRSPDVPVRGI